jgi:putative FmdB family regulatory protein
MPTYQYACRSCGHRFDAVQGFDEASLTTCPACHREELRKLFGNVGVVFKGSGFYRTDSRNSKTSTNTGSASGSTGKDSASSDSGSGSSGTASNSGASAASTGSTKPQTPAATT